MIEYKNWLINVRKIKYVSRVDNTNILLEFGNKSLPLCFDTKEEADKMYDRLKTAISFLC